MSGKLTEAEISAGENILLGNKQFTVVESNEKISLYDPYKKQALSIFGNLDRAAVKKNLTEHFKNFPFSPYLEDIGLFVSGQKTSGGVFKNVTGTEYHKEPFKILAGPPTQSLEFERHIEAAKKAGYVQGVCECVAAIGGDYALGKKLLTEMNVTKKMAKEYARPKTYEILESGIFAQGQEQKLERQQRRGRGL